MSTPPPGGSDAERPQISTEAIRWPDYLVKIWMGLMMDAGADEGEIRQFMNLQSRGANFTQMYNVLM